MQPMWVVAMKPYRETSCLVTLLTGEDRVVRASARGSARGPNRLCEFQPLFGALGGRDDRLMRLSGCEAGGARLPLTGTALVSALYLNEITYWIVPDGVVIDGLFHGYTEALRAISIERYAVLRRYERLLIESAGYYPLLTADQIGQAIAPERWYRLVNLTQLVEVMPEESGAILGERWLCVDQSRYDEPEAARLAKWLHRQLIDRTTGNRRLVSRELL